MNRNPVKLLEVRNGSYFTGAPDEIILPQEIAGQLGVKLGDTVILASMTESGFLNMTAVTLVGIQKVLSTTMIFGYYQGFAPLAAVQALVDTDKVSEVISQPSRFGLLGLKGGFRLVPAMNAFGVARAVAMVYLFLRWLIVLFLGAFAFGIVYQNVTMMNDSRRSEIAVYLTYGAKQSWIASIMYGELAVYAVFCALIGGLLGIAFLGGLTQLGLYPVDIVTEVMMGGEELNLWPGPLSWFYSLFILMALMFVSATAPIRKAVGSCDIVRLFRK